MAHQTDRRKFFRRLTASAGAIVLAGCDKLSDSEWFGKVLSTGESLNKNVHPCLTHCQTILNQKVYRSQSALPHLRQLASGAKNFFYRFDAPCLFSFFVGRINFILPRNHRS